MTEIIMNANAQNENTQAQVEKAVPAVEEKKVLDLSKVEKMFELPTNLPFPKDTAGVIAELPTLKHMTVAELLADFQAEKIVIPGFQRAEVWDDSRKKALEFSVLHGYPVPPIMLIRSKDKLNLDDGQQRLKALKWAVEVYEKGTADIKAELAKGLAQGKAKENLEAVQKKVSDRLTALKNAKIPVMIFPEMEETAEKYSYAALNNGKTHSGSEWGRAFIPALGMDFVQSVTAQTKHIFGKKSVDFALYLWAGMGGNLRKTPAGKKVFPVVRRESETNEKFVFPILPEEFAVLISAIESRPVSNNEDYNRNDFCKPGFLVPMIQGLKFYGSWDFALLAYAVRNIDKYITTKVSIVDKEARGKNGPVMLTRAFANLLAKTGSGESLTWKKAQGWKKILEKAKADMDNAQVEETKDEMLSELENAVRAMEGEEDED